MTVTDIPTLNLGDIQPAVGRDDAGRPTLILTDGDTEVVLVGADAHIDTLSGLRQIINVIWEYQQEIVHLRLAGEREAPAAVDDAHLAATAGTSTP